MLKKMLISMTAMGVTAAAAVIMLISLIPETTSGNPEKKDTLGKSFSDDTYFYYLSEEESVKIIDEWAGSFISLEEYLLPADSEAEDVAFAYIETPALTTARMASEAYQLYGRRIKIQEVKKEWMDSYLPFAVRFKENKGFLYEAVLEQDREILFGDKEEVAGGGTLMRVYFNVSQIDFGAEARLVLKNTVTGDEIIFTVVFSDYK